jgi:sugar lactone lactonase YvrE
MTTAQATQLFPSRGNLITITEGRRVVAGPFRFTECPRWWNNRLYFPDISSRKVHYIDERGETQTLVEFPIRCSGIGFLPDGDLLAVLKDNTLARVSNGKISHYADLQRFADTTINDMVVTKTGRAYVTQLGPEKPPGTMPRDTRIVTVELGGEARVAVEGLKGPNGIAVTDDERTLVVSESGASRLAAFDIDRNGDLSNERTFGKLWPGCYPDGMCLDAQGGAWAGAVVWIGPPRIPGPGFVRFAANGEITHLIPLEPGRHAVACVMGGEGRKTLFMATSAAVGLGEDSPFIAHIEAIEIEGISGAGIP